MWGWRPAGYLQSSVKTDQEEHARSDRLKEDIFKSAPTLCKALSRRTTPEFECLQAKWAAHLPYRQANALLKEVLPLDDAISFGAT